MGYSNHLLVVAGWSASDRIPPEGRSLAQRFAAGGFAGLPEAEGAETLEDFLRAFAGEDAVFVAAPELRGAEGRLIVGVRVLDASWQGIRTAAEGPLPEKAFERALAAASGLLEELGIRQEPRLFLFHRAV